MLIEAHWRSVKGRENNRTRDKDTKAISFFFFFRALAHVSFSIGHRRWDGVITIKQHWRNKRHLWLLTCNLRIRKTKQITRLPEKIKIKKKKKTHYYPSKIVKNRHLNKRRILRGQRNKNSKKSKKKQTTNAIPEKNIKERRFDQTRRQTNSLSLSMFDQPIHWPKHKATDRDTAAIKNNLE